jgi:surface antigen
LGGKIKSRRKLVRASLLLGEAFLLLAAIALIKGSTNAQSQINSTPLPLASAVTNSSSSVNPLDQLSSAMIALTVARLANLPETTAVTNQADSEIALLSVASTNNDVISKPQVVTTNYVSNRDIKVYIVQPGDSITSIAQKFNLSTNSIIWSNNIVGNYVAVGSKLLIPPINGIVYTVKSGDTPASLAQKYSSNESLLIAYNDAEIKGIYPGERIIIPNGTEPATISYVNALYGWGSSPIYGYNGYDYGNCTYWVAYLRAKAGRPLPADLGNASTWAIRAQQFGLAVGTTPAVGAAVVLSTAAYYGEGHVAYVTAVNPNGTITISEMNFYGWNIVDTRTIPSAGYEYIY